MKKTATTEPKPVVTYFRVSTQQQGASGLGLDAQREAVRRYLAGREPIGEFTEVESGKRKDRPQLGAAIELCRKTGATLIIAKLDRLARNVAFLSTLMESGLDFTAVDLPEADRLTIHLLAAVAEHEARLISQRTKAALAQAKLRGKRLGNPRAAESSHLGGAGRAKVADAFALSAMPAISRVRSSGITAPRLIAEELNAWAVVPPSGKRTGGWSASSVRKTIRRAARFTSDYTVTAEDEAGDLDVLYQEEGGEVLLAFA
jgi:DNA invertase Pin-like site-specific DNA recombinase